MCQACELGAKQGFSRRDFLKFSSLFSLAGAAPLLQQLQAAQAKEPQGPVKIGYLPITDAAPLLIAHQQGFFAHQGIEVEKPRMFRSWAQLVEAFLSGQVNLVHLLAPMCVWARYASQAPVKVVAWNHLNGSSLTVSVTQNIQNLKDLGGTSFAVPFWYSIHNILLQQLLQQAGLTPIQDGTPTKQQVKLVVMAPSDMLPALATERISGYLVAEPFNAAAEEKQVGKILRFSGDVWRDHACCLVLMHERDLGLRPEWSQKVVNGLVEAQLWLNNNRQQSVEILSKDNPARYTPHSQATLAQVLNPAPEAKAAYIASGAIQNPSWQAQRLGFQPYPYPSYTRKLVELMQQTQVKGDTSFLNKLDPNFVAEDLVAASFVTQAINSLGGMQAFGQASFERSEVLDL